MRLTLFIGSGGEVDDRGELGLFVKSKLGKVANLVYGPYQKYPPGEYEVTFELVTDKSFVNDGRDLCVMDVATGAGRETVCSLPVNSSALVAGERKSFTLGFAIDRPAALEFRVHTKGSHNFAVNYERDVRRKGNSALGDQTNKFYRENISTFLGYECDGATVVPREEGVLVNLMGLSILTRVRTDFALIREILLNNNYQFRANGNFCVIDVGMNIGIASLFFAKMPQVQTVYSFEPFKIPFNRARENFALNPSFANKIVAKQIALAGKNGIAEVKVSGTDTIGTSIRGLPRGELTDKIEIREASEVLGPIIDQAAKDNLCVVLKLDCEGSEFAILSL